MKKLISILVISQVLMLITISNGASSRCTVTQVDGSRLVIDCGKNASEFKKQDKIKIKTAQHKTVEGC